MTTSPARTGRPIPSTVMDFEMPSGSARGTVEKSLVVVLTRGLTVSPFTCWEKALVEHSVRKAARKRSMFDCVIVGVEIMCSAWSVFFRSCAVRSVLAEAVSARSIGGRAGGLYFKAFRFLANLAR